jgi:hypothetical protein
LSLSFSGALNRIIELPELGDALLLVQTVNFLQIVVALLMQTKVHTHLLVVDGIWISSVHFAQFFGLIFAQTNLLFDTGFLEMLEGHNPNRFGIIESEISVDVFPLIAQFLDHGILELRP